MQARRRPRLLWLEKRGAGVGRGLGHCDYRQAARADLSPRFRPDLPAPCRSGAASVGRYLGKSKAPLARRSTIGAFVWETA